MAKLTLTKGEYDILRENWLEILTGGTRFNENDPNIRAKLKQMEETVDDCWRSLLKNPDRTYLWEDYRAEAKTFMTKSFNRLLQMAVAYKTKGCKFENNKELLKDIIEAFEWMGLYKYHTQEEREGSWWDWEIGSPRLINNILCLLYDDLPAGLADRYIRAIDHIIPDPARNNYKKSVSSGANRVWLCGIVALRGIIGKDGDKIAMALQKLIPVLDYVTKDDGYYEDGSFIQHHSIAYAGGYGLALIQELGSLLCIFKGSQWEIGEKEKQRLFEIIENSYRPFVYKGVFMEMLRGRYISRHVFNSHTDCVRIIHALILFSQVVPDKIRKAYGGLIQLWRSQNPYLDCYEEASVYLIEKMRGLLGEAEHRKPFIGTKICSGMDKVVVQREDFAVGIAMHSENRTSSFEIIGAENKKGYYTSAGTVYFYNNDLNYYADHFWPTVDELRLPGVTAFAGTAISPYAKSNDFAGGACIHNLYAAVGMRFMPEYDLDAKKSYFILGDKLLFMGTVSSGEKEHIVETTIENRKIQGGNKLIVNGKVPIERYGETEIQGVKWLHLSGDEDGCDIGYYFPNPAKLNFLRENRAFSWNSLNQYFTGAEAEKIREKEYITIRDCHGTAPQDRPYAYVLMPNQPETAVRAYSENPDIIIVRQDGKAHAAVNRSLGITAVNFWEDEVVNAGGIICDTRASVIMQQTGDELVVGVSDPTQANAGSITIEIEKPARKIIYSDVNIHSVLCGSSVRFTVDVKDKLGQTSVIKLAI